MNAIFYPAIFHPEETGYSVEIPDIEGCFTQGDTMDEAVRMAQDAIGLMLEDCKVCPEPSVPSALHVDPEDFVVMVPFDMEEYEKRYRPVKKTLSIPGRLNDAAESAHINFSGVLQDPYLCFSSTIKPLTVCRSQNPSVGFMSLQIP